MKKFCLCFYLTFCVVLFLNANIEYNINKHGVMFVHFVVNNENPTIDLFKDDWSNAVNIAASNNSVKQIQFMDSKDEMIAWINKENLSNSKNVLEDVIIKFDSFNETENVYGDSVLVKKKTPAQYHSDTYKNGKLESTYSSDWNLGYFPPSTSTYVSGGVTYVTKKYYSPEKTRNIWEKRILGKKIVKKGEDVRIAEIYIRR